MFRIVSSRVFKGITCRDLVVERKELGLFKFLNSFEEDLLAFFNTCYGLLKQVLTMMY